MFQVGSASEQPPENTKAFNPSLGVRFDYDSNIYDTNSTVIASWIATLSPVIVLSSAPAQQQYVLSYRGNYGYYFADSDDNYADHLLGGLARFKLSDRMQFDLGLTTEKGHWDRGSYQTAGIDPESPSFPAEPDQFDRNSWKGRLQYGADGNRGRLRFSIGGTQLDYTNNLERTQFFDYKTQSAGAGISVLFHRRTTVTFDAMFLDTKFDKTQPGEASLDSDDWRYLIGLSWKATAKTAGTIRVGVEQRRFDDPSRESTSNPSWDINIRWAPRQYSYFDFSTSRVNEESPREAAFVDTKSFSVAWTHEFNDRWQSVVGWTQSDYNFIGAPRDQDLNEVSVGVRFKQGRLVSWQTGYAWRSRDSNLDSLIYDGDLFSIGVTLGN